MIIQGNFNDIDNNIVTVTITKNDGDNTIVEIGENGLFFGGEPVTIETDLSSTFDPIIRKSCTINFVTDHYIGDLLWSENAGNITVNINKSGNSIFTGYVEPNTFSQPFVSLDEFSINCIDVLSALQYYNYKDIKLNDYDTAKVNAEVVPFHQMLLQSLAIATGTQNINPSRVNWRVYYDCSKGTEYGKERTVFTDLGISENYLLGDSFDDVWTCEDVISEMLQYLNLHIIQQGDLFYIFDWDTLRNKRNTWFELTRNQSVSMTVPQNVAITGKMHGASDTTITVSDVYNQVSVKCDLNNIEEIITSPFDDDSLISPYSGKQLYMREYISEGNGSTAKKAFISMVKENGEAITYDKAKYIDWYLRVMRNPNWLFHRDNGDGDISDIFEQSNGTFINQWKIPHNLSWDGNRLWSAILNMGSVERDAKVTDNEPIAKVSMTNYLYISINGNGVDDDTNAVPTVAELQSHSPIIEYLGGNGGVYSPSDEETTNYLVFGGSLQLQPLTEETDGFTSLKNKIANNVYFSKTVPSDNNENGRFYTRKFFKIENPTDPVDETVWLDDSSLQPWVKDKANHLFQFNYSEFGENQDLVSKLPVLECELIIGNKRLIETNIDRYGNSEFHWVELGSEPTWHDEENNVDVTTTTFTLGVNPKIGDYIIGTDFKLQNTVNISMNIDADGTAIPIKKSDNLSGAIQFRILGPVNSTWNDITRRHPTWFRHTKWSANDKVVLSHVESIILKDFSCKIYSDNAKNETTDNDELIYMSDETDRYINKHDDTEFKFITQPTSDVIISQGLKSGANINAVINMNDNTPITSIYNATTGETAKAEEHFIDQYYNEYCAPKLEMQMTIHNGDNISWRNNFISTPLGKNFFVIAMNEDVRMNTSQIKLKSK